MRKLQCAERGVARRAMRLFLHGPIEKPLALFDEENLQFTRGMRLRQQRFLLSAYVEVHQRHRQFAEPARAAQQMTIDERLRPMQRAVVGGHPFERAAMGLDLFQAVRRRVVAVGAAAHGQAAMRARQRDLAFIAARAPPGDRHVARHAFERRGRGRKAQIEIAAPRGEFAHRPHGDHVSHAAASVPAVAPVSFCAPASSAQRTSSTRTGMPCCAQYASQRIWLSCKRSPGPFTSISS
jgi:hypothetical protein